MTLDRSFPFLVLAFTMLWLPVGQYPFLIDHWMKIGTFMAPFLLLVAFAFKQPKSEKASIDFRLASLILLVAYIVHQFEEHWIDIFGNVYAFQGHVNAVLLGALDAPAGAEWPLTKEVIFFINTSLVWLVAALAIWSAPRHVFPALAMMGIVLVNAVAHINTTVTGGGYNPGLLTSLVIFLPLSLTFYVKSVRSGLASLKEVLASVLWAVLAHVVMIAGVLGANWFNLFPEQVYYVLLILWSIVPVFMFRSST
ncbi:MAG: HXXEE domain-containing protein [Pseudomonadota bacterium]